MPDTQSPRWPAHFIDRGARPAHEQDISARIAHSLRLPEAVAQALCRLYSPLAALCAARAPQRPNDPLFVGVNGAQGTGKSTAAHIVKDLLESQFGLRVCVLSIDDVYLSRAARAKLAREVHPLLATRGVPGTHDLPLALAVFQQLSSAGADTLTPIPRFDKSLDDCVPEQHWQAFKGRPDVVLFEGWCVGARAQRIDDLQTPVNSLERDEDADGHWRAFVNDSLQGYQQLFAQLDLLVMLKAPSFDQVLQWRQLQEDKLRDGLSAEQLAHSRVMSPPQIERFIAHYERLTRWMLQEMPARADIVLSLGEDHQIATIECHI